MSGTLPPVNPDALPPEKYYRKISELPNPADKMLLADSWHYYGNNHAIYIDFSLDEAFSAMSFRHNGGLATNMLYFDGHSATKNRPSGDWTQVQLDLMDEYIKPSGW